MRRFLSHFTYKSGILILALIISVYGTSFVEKKFNVSQQISKIPGEVAGVFSTKINGTMSVLPAPNEAKAQVTSPYQNVSGDVLISGNVGIGTVGLATQKLDVNGTAKATTFLGDLTGNVTGNVTGNLNGNASTVTNGVYTTTGANRFPLNTWMNASGAGPRNWYIGGADMYWEIGGAGAFHFRNSGDADVATINTAGLYSGTAQNANQLIGKNWYWNGQTGQPSWLWGGSDNVNMYVYNPSNFVVNNVTALGGTWTSNNLFKKTSPGVYLANNSWYPLEAYSDDGGAAAMSFHRGGAYAVNMGLDPDNVFRIGGWSAGARRWELDMSGNSGNAGGVYSNDPSYGYIGIDGDLPGQPANTFPTLRTTYTYLYFSAGGAYSAYMESNGTWHSVSDRNKKENFVPVNTQDILAKINNMPMYQWNFKTDDPSVTHIAPVAQDFHNAFGLDGENDTMISGIDPSGVAIVGVKALSEKIDAQQKEIDALKQEIENLKKAIQ